jgi:hypothetical protein
LHRHPDIQCNTSQIKKKKHLKKKKRNSRHYTDRVNVKRLHVSETFKQVTISRLSRIIRAWPAVTRRRGTAHTNEMGT